MRGSHAVKAFFSALCSLGLTACATAYPGSPQACAGVNDAHVEWNEKNGTVAADLCGGKENDSVRLSGKTPGGMEFSYEAEGARGFEGQLTNADMNRDLGMLRAEIIREIAGAVAAAIHVNSSSAP
jgi:hypothetical protein